MMRARLGDALWNDFVSHANRHYKAAYVGAFNTRTLRCVGTVDGNACAQTFEIDQCAPDAKEKLEFLHLDHEQPVHLTCAWWTSCLPHEPRAWDDGLDGTKLCHKLFGVCDDAVHGACCVRFRCGPRRGSSGERVCFAQHMYCHTS